ncbi:hypothetical protein HYX16_04995 [Candidatus Woesearchaeota archaeon]|nr:hypothetical protein [Candidatus Woesearchaeota archaeon]
MRYLLILLLITVFLIQEVTSQDCNSACLTSGYSSGQCTVDCKEIKILSESCKISGSANLILGTNSGENYKDADSYKAQDPKDPDWVWIIKNIKTEASTNIESTTNDAQHTGPIIGVKNDFIATDIDSIDTQAISVGNSYCFPGDEICIKFNKLTVSNYTDYTIKKTTVDLSSFNSSWANKDALLINSEDESEGLKLDTANYDIVASGASGKKINNIWIVFNNTGSYAGIFYEGASNSKVAAGYLNMNSGSVDINVADINYQETKDNDVQIDLRGDFGTANSLSLVLDILAFEGAASVNGADDIKINLRHDASSNILGFGNSTTTADEADIVWSSSETKIGKKDFDLKSLYGIIIKNPNTNNPKEQVLLEVPEDQVKAEIEISRSPLSFTKTTASTTISEGERIPSPLFEDELTFKEDKNLILVGGPCANSIVEDFKEFPKCKDWPLQEGEAMIKYTKNGKNTALLIAGTTKEDTEMAAKFFDSLDTYGLKGDYITLVFDNPAVVSSKSEGVDISDYPFPFLKDGKVQNVALVVGKKSDPKDIYSSQILANNLLWITRTTVNESSSSETQAVTDTLTDEIPLGSNLADATFFSSSLTSKDIPSLAKGVITLGGKNIDYHEEIILYGTGPSLETSLSSSDDTYKSNVYMEAPSGSLRYYFVFDSPIDISKVSVDSPLTIEFLESIISITKTESATEFKSHIGENYFLEIGQNVTVNGVNIKLLNTVPSGKVVIEINNTGYILDADGSKFISGIEIINSEAFKQSSEVCCCSDLLKFL